MSANGRRRDRKRERRDAHAVAGQHYVAALKRADIRRHEIADGVELDAAIDVPFGLVALAPVELRALVDELTRRRPPLAKPLPAELRPLLRELENIAAAVDLQART